MEIDREIYNHLIDHLRNERVLYEAPSNEEETKKNRELEIIAMKTAHVFISKLNEKSPGLLNSVINEKNNWQEDFLEALASQVTKVYCKFQSDREKIITQCENLSLIQSRISLKNECDALDTQIKSQYDRNKKLELEIENESRRMRDLDDELRAFLSQSDLSSADEVFLKKSVTKSMQSFKEDLDDYAQVLKAETELVLEGFKSRLQEKSRDIHQKLQLYKKERSWSYSLDSVEHKDCITELKAKHGHYQRLISATNEKFEEEVVIFKSRFPKPSIEIDLELTRSSLEEQINELLIKREREEAFAIDLSIRTTTQKMEDYDSLANQLRINLEHCLEESMNPGLQDFEELILQLDDFFSR